MGHDSPWRSAVLTISWWRSTLLIGADDMRFDLLGGSYYCGPSFDGPVGTLRHGSVFLPLLTLTGRELVIWPIMDAWHSSGRRRSSCMFVLPGSFVPGPNKNKGLHEHCHVSSVSLSISTIRLCTRLRANFPPFKCQHWIMDMLDVHQIWPLV